MKIKTTPPQLTDDEQKQIRAALMVGLDRQAAAHCIGYSLLDIHRAMGVDRKFAKEILRTEASAELRHMKNIHVITDDPKNWKASVWWLEQRSPERYARSAGAITSRQLKLFTSLVVEMLNEEVRCTEDRQCVMKRLLSFVSALEETLYDPTSHRVSFFDMEAMSFSESPDAETESPMTTVDELHDEHDKE